MHRCLTPDWQGATVSTETEMAATNDVLPDRPNKLTNLIDGSISDGVTFADKEQDETVVIALKAARRVSGVFVDYFEGDGQQVPPSRVPEATTISVSIDGATFQQVAVLDGKDVTSRSRVRLKKAPLKGFIAKALPAMPRRFARILMPKAEP